VYLYNLEGASISAPTPASTLINPKLFPGDEFGFSVAFNGKFAVIGAPLSDVGAAGAGLAHLADLSGAARVLVSSFGRSAPSAGDEAAYSVAVSGGHVV